MSQIHRLPKDLAEKIAAGEVIERPASVVKELLENCIDAGAGRIVIDLEGGGVRMISVADDGRGMTPDELPLAFERHCTSKLSTLEDLFAIRTLGFRGEALPSIAAVSRVEAVSTARGEASGARIEIIGGQMGEVRPEGAPVGTRIIARDLFFNTPARRKFLKKESTELGHITAVVQNIALAHPAIHIELSHNGRQVFGLPAAADRRERIAGLFGAELARDLIQAEHEETGIRFHAFLAPRQHTRTNRRSQFVFVNRRYVREPLLAGAIQQAYRGFIESGRYPVAFLFLEIDPAEIDVNVHPAKLEIRFRNASQVYASTLRALRSELEATWPREAFLDDPETLDERRERIRKRIGDFFLRAERSQRQASLFEPSGRAGHADAPGAPSLPQPPPEVMPAHRVMQIHNTYLVEETASGFRISDQHALHERVLFEEVRKRLGESSMASQQLLTPQMMNVTEQDVLAIEEHAELFRRVGLEVVPAGPRTIAINAVPEVLPVEEAPAFLRDALDRIQAEESDDSLERRIEEVSSALACRAAVKAGEELTAEEIQSLVTRADTARVNETCPHGRPATLYFSLDELERRFERK